MRNELQAMTAFEAAIQPRSFAECCSNTRANADFTSSQGAFRSNFRRHSKRRPVERVSTIPVSNPPGALTGFNRLARCCIIPLLGDGDPDVRDEAM